VRSEEQRAENREQRAEKIRDIDIILKV